MRLSRLRSPFLLHVALLCTWINVSASCSDHDQPLPDPPEPQEIDPRCNECNATRSPVYVGAGAFVRPVTDLNLAGEVPISLTRFYNSTYAKEGPFGKGWATTIPTPRNATVFSSVASGGGGGIGAYADTGVRVLMLNGRRYSFKNPHEGTVGVVEYDPPLGRHDKLEILPEQAGIMRITLEHGEGVYDFSPQGQLLRQTDARGNTVTYTYSGDKVTSISNGAHILSIFWSGARISSATGEGVSFAYNYYGSGTGKKQGMLQSVVGSNGYAEYYDYDVTYSKNEAGDPDIRFAPLFKGAWDKFGRELISARYDYYGRVVSYAEKGITYTYSYTSPSGNTVKKHSSLATSTDTTYGTTGYEVGLVTQDAPDEPNWPAEQTNYASDGQVGSYTDSTGVTSTFQYNPQGYATDASFANGAVHYKLTRDLLFPWRVTYALPVKTDGATYDPKWQAYKMDYWQVDDAATGAKKGQLKTLYQVYNYKANPTDAELKSDVLATFQYDAAGRMLSAQDTNGNQTQLVYDGFGNVTDLYKPANNDGNVRPHYHFDYDPRGRVTEVTDALGHTASYRYDGQSRITSITLPKPSAAFTGGPFTTTVAYDQADATYPNLRFVVITDPNGQVTKRGYDQWGRLGLVVDAKGAKTSLAYSGDLLSSITDANGNVTGYGYDSRERLNQTTFPDGTLEYYSYSRDGLLTRKQDRRGYSTYFEYDALKRLTQKRSADGIVNFYYGTENNGSLGQNLTSVVDGTTSPGETQSFAYDGLFRLQGVTQGPRGTVSYAYNPDNTLASYTVAGGASASYGYYPDHSLRTIDWSRIAGSFKYDYTLNGQYQKIAFPNAQSRNFAYDDQGRLTSLSNLAPGGANLASYAYGYDLNNLTGAYTMLGQRTSMTADVPAQGQAGAQTLYGYDANYQLIKAVYPAAAPYNGAVYDWSYDAIGNRLSETVNGGAPTNYTYATNPPVAPATIPTVGQKLLSWGDSSMAYDNNGNPTSWNDHGTTRTLAWSYSDNRLNSIGGTGAASYGYDFSGRRTTITKNAQTTSDLYNGFDLVAQAGTNAAEFLYGPGIDQPLAMNQSGTASYYAVDGLGSVAGMSNSAGTFTANYAYDAWGQIKAQSGTSANPFGYTGRETAENGLDFYRARFYNPGVGRFMNEDMLRDIPGDNFYHYVYGNPIAFIDPLGLSAWSVAGNFVLGFGEGLIGAIVVGALVTTATAIGAPIILAVIAGAAAVAIVGVGSYNLGIGLQKVILGHDPYTGKAICTKQRLDMGARILGGVLGGALGARGYQRGSEYKVPGVKGANGKPMKIAPFGNRRGHEWGELPHYHYGVPNPSDPTNSLPDQGYSNHRPWEGGWGIDP